MMKKQEYKRNADNVGKYILKVLQTLGGSASRQLIKEGIVDDDEIDISYEDVFEPIMSKKGTKYIPFNMDFNFSLVNLLNCGYIQAYGRGGDIVLTEKGRCRRAGCPHPAGGEAPRPHAYRRQAGPAASCYRV